MNTTTMTKTKVAWIRDASVPVGQTAMGKLNCTCGNAPWTFFKEAQGEVTCNCGRVYTWDGWIIQDKP